MWTLSVRPSRESGLAPVDVVVRAQPGATVLDLAGALGRHLSPAAAGTLVVPAQNGNPWPADRKLDECGLRPGAVLEAVTVPDSWARRPGPPPRRRAVLRVVAGPDAGLTVPVTSDSAVLGRGPECTISLKDPLVSRRHARILLTPATPVVVDEGSAHGTSVSGAIVRRPTPVEWGTPIELGGTSVVLDPVESDRRGNGVLRPPRFGEPLREDTLEVPSPPTKQDTHMAMWGMMAMPLVFGIGMLFTNRGPLMLVYLLGWPIAIFAMHYFQKRHETKRYEKELAFWREDFEAVLAELDRHNEAQRERAFEDHPGLDEVPRRVLTRHPALWNRRDFNPDFLSYRVGLGPVAAMLGSDLKDGGERDEVARARTELALRRVLPDMPVCLSTNEIGLVALAGPRAVVDAVARALIVRLSVDHSPTDLSVAAVLSREAAHHETWLRWLPQVTRRVGGTAPVAVGPADGHALLDLLAAAENGTGQTLCVVDEDAGVPRRAVEAVAAVAAERRLRLLWLGRDPRFVPSGADVLIDLTASVPAKMITAAMTRPGEEPPAAVAEIAHRDRTGVALVTALDTLDLGAAWTVARSMTDYTDEAAVLPPDTALPEVVRLPEVTGDLTDPDDEAPVLERWRASRGLRAQIGMGVDGPVTLDLRGDGPHGLVAGTTGSGKSELLQTLICSLALNNPPSRMTFLLVDYKGGAAFRECADLPHAVGYITDLTPALVKRALTSLLAEVNYREEILERYGAKDQIALEREHPEACPPSLLICVDEFAALVAEVPDFVDGMVNIAQRGRSLGMHMLLATQRPAGVITAQIKANTDLRIALRVNSTDDSDDVIERKDAATISRRTPGRAWIRRTGHGTTELVQSAWVGAREELRAAGQRVDVRPFSAIELRGDEGYDMSAGSVRLHARTDLDRLVTTIGEAFAHAGSPRPKKPWLPALPVELPLGCREPGELLIGAAAADEERVPGTAEEILRLRAGAGQVPLGQGDRPRQQSQPPVLVDYAQIGHLLVYGTSGSGKTELLRTVAISATLAAGPDEPAPYIYGIDFAGGGLGVLDGWPAVGSIIKEQQSQRVLRLLRMLKRTVDERNAALAATGAADLESLAVAGYPMPRIHVLIDNLPSLNDTLDGGGAITRQHAELLATVLQEGRRTGVHITASSPRRTGISAQQQASFGERLVLRMTTDDDYMMLGAPGGVVTADSPPGRGLLGRTEVQVATVGGAGTPVQPERLRTLAALVAGRYADAAAVPVPGMPDLVPQGMLPEPVRDQLVIAVEADYVTGITVALTDGPLLITGRARSGRTGALAGIAGLARRSDVPPAEIVLLGPGATPASEFDTVLDSLDAVAAWLPGWMAGLASDGGWRLLLMDDAHVWERSAEAGGAARDTLAALAALTAEAAGLGLAVVVATDPDESRGRQYVDSPVQAAKRGRRGMLLQPEYADGSLLAIEIPTKTIEPMTGSGRGLWCSSGIAQVAHIVSGVGHRD